MLYTFLHKRSAVRAVRVVFVFSNHIILSIKGFCEKRDHRITTTAFFYGINQW